MGEQDSVQRGCAYSFLDFTLDPAAERLTQGTTEIKLRPKSFQVMRYLVERPGRLVTREELLQAIWNDVIVTDESLTKCIADIRKALGDDSQEIVRTVTRRGFIFRPEVRSTASGWQTPRPENSSVRSFFSRPALLVMALALAGVSAGLMSLQWRGRLFGRATAFQAIAVLPFESLSSGEGQQYLADGMTETLITDLGQVSRLRVIARTSVNQYQKTKKPIGQIARELKVDALVEGTIAESGNRIRVTANLIQVSPEKLIWAHSYERNSRDTLSLENEIAGAIAGEIQGKLSPQQQARLGNSRPVNSDAQVAYWKARYFQQGRRNAEGARKSVEYSEEAVRIDPGYAAAHAGLARAYEMMSLMGVASPGEIVPRAKMAAERAVALDDELPEAHVALGEILYAYEWDWAAAERELRQAINLNPSNADARSAMANYLAAVGRVDEAVVEIRRARELDPFSFVTNRDVGRMLYFARRYDEALAELRQTGDMQPNSSVVDLWIVKSYLQKGQPDEAVNADLRVRRARDGFDEESLAVLRTIYAKKGLQEYWRKVIELAFPKFQSTAQGSYMLTELSILVGDTDAAFRWFEKAFQLRSGFMPWVKVDPTLDPLRRDPRFGAILQRMGYPPRQP